MRPGWTCATPRPAGRKLFRSHFLLSDTSQAPSQDQKSTNAHKLHRRGKDKRRQRQRHEFIFRDDIPVQAMHQLWSGNSTPAVNKRTQH
jgi:hypothetical protein